MLDEIENSLTFCIIEGMRWIEAGVDGLSVLFAAGDVYDDTHQKILLLIYSKESQLQFYLSLIDAGRN